MLLRIIRREKVSRKRQYTSADSHSTLLFVIPYQKVAIAFLLIANTKNLSIK